LAAHRVVWAIVHGEWPAGQIDHIDGDRSNNRIGNLRVVSTVENARNAGVYSTNRSGVSGVTWRASDKRWMVTISVENSTRYIGCYQEQWVAIVAREAAEAALGYHANHGKRPAFRERQAVEGHSNHNRSIRTEAPPHHG
jgi:hypothetical protein